MLRILIFLVAALIFLNCTTEKGIIPEDNSTWSTIQSEIFQPSCVPCHQAGTSFASQSDLILTADIAYDQLVNRLPKNSAARADGLLLVGTEGLESLYASFLWEKIDAVSHEHFYEDHPKYGEIMPNSGLALTNGELKMIRDWIVAGAPEQGDVVDASVLKDETRYEFPDEEYIPLAIPPSGYQLIVGPFNVNSNFEREFFYYKEIGNEQIEYVNRIEINMRKGSHHFIMYDFPQNDFPEKDVYRDIRQDNNEYNFETVASIANQRFVFGTQWRSADYSFPPGVALRIPANAAFDLNSHYVNRTSDSFEGEVGVNLHTIPESEVEFVAENLFLNNQLLLLPPKQVTTVTKTWIFEERRVVFQLYSHAHEHMTEFKIYIAGGARDGELVYFANDWQHPPLLELDPPIILEKGEGFRAETTYNNTTSRTLVFGLLSVDEMMIILGAYYTE